MILDLYVHAGNDHFSFVFDTSYQLLYILHVNDDTDYDDDSDDDDDDDDEGHDKEKFVCIQHTKIYTSQLLSRETKSMINFPIKYI